jgi:hypothetical protein
MRSVVLGLFLAASASSAGCGAGSTPPPEPLAVTVEAIEPARGPIGGGTPVSVHGAHFGDTANVEFGDGVYATAVVVRDATSLTCLAPPGVAGTTVDVTITTRAARAVLRGGFTYLRPAALTGVDPPTGSSDGGTLLTLVGSGFEVPGLRVSVGDRFATAVSPSSDTLLTCLSPASAVRGPVPVTVRTDGGTATLDPGHTFLATLGVAAVRPSTGFAPGGDDVRVRGAGYQHLAGASSVLFGAASATDVAALDDDTLRCTTPAARAGESVEVRVTNDRGSASLPDAFLYFAYPPAFRAANARLGHQSAVPTGALPADACCDGAHAYVAWSDARYGKGDVFFNRSLDGGATWWDDEVRLNLVPAGSAETSDPTLLCRGSTVCVVWWDRRDGRGDVHFRRSTDAGATWSDETRLDRDPAGLSESSHPVICGDGAAIYVAWIEIREGKQYVLFNRSLDDGATWLPTELRVSDDLNARPHSPRIACDGASVHVAWIEPSAAGTAAHVRFDRSLNAGVTWLASDLVLDVPGGATITSPASLACDGANVHVAWCDGRFGLGDVFFTRSTDAGATWLQANRRLDTDAPGQRRSQAPALAVEGPDVYVVWADDRTGLGRNDIYLNRSSDGGATWLAADVRISTGLEGAHARSDPRIACSGGNVYAAWSDARFSAWNEVFFNCSSDRGATWLSNDVRLNDDAAGSSQHVLHGLCADGARVHAVWYDTRHSADDSRGDVYVTATRP